MRPSCTYFTARWKCAPERCWLPTWTTRRARRAESTISRPSAMLWLSGFST
jgi:hypothetical protein